MKLLDFLADSVLTILKHSQITQSSGLGTEGS